MSFKKAFTKAADMRILYPVGAGLDLISGSYIVTSDGAAHLNGGWNKIMGAGGRGNTFKSTLAHHGTITVPGRYISTGIIIYDSEDSIQRARLISWCNRYPNLEAIINEDEDFLIIVDTTTIGNKFFAQLKEAGKEKIKEFINKKLTTPFEDSNGELIKVLPVTTGEIDSFSKMPIEVVETIYDKNEIGDSGANVYAMREMGAKTQLMNQLPAITTHADFYFTLVAHMTDEIAESMYQGSTKKLGYMKNKMKFVGVPNGYTFLTNTLYINERAYPLVDKDKGPLYRRDPKVCDPSVDLMAIDITVARCKTAPSGTSHTIVSSQEEGVDPGLSNLHNLRVKYQYWGLAGNNTTFATHFLPEGKMTRNNCREKLKTMPGLERAVEITFYLKQLFELHRAKYEEWLCEPEVLYNDLKEMGYDWNKILTKTREYWVFLEQEESEPLRELTVLSLLRMRTGDYTPPFADELKV